ncbi:protein OCTOPUS-like [Wolffia australiana]
MAAQPPPQLPMCNRAPSACDRHPSQRVTGFCAACLRERLEGLDTANRRLGDSSPPSGASAALRSLFFPPSALPSAFQRGNTDSSVDYGPELRRCKSFSGRPPPPHVPAAEPQRRSCDVRGRSTLGTLFHLDDAAAAPGEPVSGEPVLEPLSRRLGPIVAAAVPETREEEDDGDEQAAETGEGRPGGVAAEIEEPCRGGEQTPPPAKDWKETAGSFWLAASVFSKKLQKWRRKQKLTKQATQGIADGGSGCSALGSRRDKPAFVFPFPSRSRRFSRGTSLAEYDGFGRRSCDTEPRCSMDAGRMSVDDPAFSWDEPRASWDGHLTRHRTAPPRQRPMLPVAEDPPGSAPAVQRLDGQIPVEEDDGCPQPGGATQTRDYYLSSSQRRPARRSLDRSSLSSVRRSFSAEGDVSALPKSVIRSSSSSTEYDIGESAPGGNTVDSEAAREGGPSKPRRGWSKAWSLWGLLVHALARGGSAGAESAAAQRRRDCGGPPRRSCSSLSSRDGPETATMTKKKGKKRTGKAALERSRSARLSPCRPAEGGLLRLYLGPTRPTSRRPASAGAALQAVHPHASAHNLALYLY